MLVQVARELRGRGGLARALQAGEQDHGRGAGGEAELLGLPPHQLGELLGDDLHHLLAGVELADDLRPQTALLDLRGELTHNLEVDVRLQQREADLAQRAVDVLLGQRPPLADIRERCL